MLAATSQPGALQLRIALALVLLEHQPAHLTLQEWLDSLRELVQERNNLARSPAIPTTAGRSLPSSQQPRTSTDKAEGNPEAVNAWAKVDQKPGNIGGRGDKALRISAEAAIPAPVGASTKEVPLSTKLRLAASTLGPGVIAALEPLLSPPAHPSPHPLPQPRASLSTAPLSFAALSAFLTALAQSLQSLRSNEEEGLHEVVAIKFEALGTVATWLFGQLASALRGEDAVGAGSEGGNGFGKVEAEKCARQLYTLLADLATTAAHHPAALQILLPLLTNSSANLSSAFSRLAQAVVLPSLFRQLTESVRSLLIIAETPPGGTQQLGIATNAQSKQVNPERTSETISTLLSLSHLVLDALPPAHEIETGTSREPSPADRTERSALALAQEDLIRLLGTHGVDVQLAELTLPFTKTTSATKTGGRAANSFGAGYEQRGEGGGISVESGIVGLLERLWELQTATAGEDERDDAGFARGPNIEGVVS
ncbi:hypothetical protein JCM10908_000114 [Rhodotorula pacifica]|uniref:uncharacterized protein n=1 Tax=Rhodotorula pacifica TaxID=1495444 RepID=UPI003170FA12